VDGDRITRRASLVRLGGLVAGAAGASALVAENAGARPAGVATGAVRCVLAPEQTEGPYYIPDERIRRDITEGLPGTPLVLRTTVVDASSCRPVRSAAVDVWHADATGTYSGFGAGAASRTFMRGVQKTDAHGLAWFRTVYPGWYPGRTVHIHVKVHIAGNVVHTGQLYFPDTLTDAVFRKAPYSSRPGRTTRNANDAVFVNGGRNSMLAVHATGSGGYVATITMGVHRA
jgi:protocatechuate 3,4-dioxygenase beta subunit